MRWAIIIRIFFPHSALGQPESGFWLGGSITDHATAVLVRWSTVFTLLGNLALAAECGTWQRCQWDEGCALVSITVTRHSQTCPGAHLRKWTWPLLRQQHSQAEMPLTICKDSLTLVYGVREVVVPGARSGFYIISVLNLLFTEQCRFRRGNWTVLLVIVFFGELLTKSNATLQTNTVVTFKLQ